jgi:hypothetical protein
MLILFVFAAVLMSSRRCACQSLANLSIRFIQTTSMLKYMNACAICIYNLIGFAYFLREVGFVCVYIRSARILGLNKLDNRVALQVGHM